MGTDEVAWASFFFGKSLSGVHTVAIHEGHSVKIKPASGSIDRVVEKSVGCRLDLLVGGEFLFVMVGVCIPSWNLPRPYPCPQHKLTSLIIYN